MEWGGGRKKIRTVQDFLNSPGQWSRLRKSQQRPPHPPPSAGIMVGKVLVQLRWLEAMWALGAALTPQTGPTAATLPPLQSAPACTLPGCFLSSGSPRSHCLYHREPGEQATSQACLYSSPMTFSPSEQEDVPPEVSDFLNFLIFHQNY